MTKLLLVLGLMLALTAAGANGRKAAATDTCTATCRYGSSVTCTVSNGTCTTSPGSVTCCGSSHTCTAINSWDYCWFYCVHGFPPPGTSGLKSEIQQNCNQKCGPVPQTSFSC
jgi:hypothetical protein